MTVHVVPESLGPVTVSAHLGAAGMRIELHATTDLGRDGLRLILNDLRRDLAAQGMTSALNVSSSLNSDAGGQGQSPGQNGFGQNGFGQNGLGQPGLGHGGAALREDAPGPPGAGVPREIPEQPLRGSGTSALTTSLDITV